MVRIVAATAVAMSVASAAAGCTAGSAARAEPEPSYGTLPTFLPPVTGRPDGILVGTAEHPALTSQGDTVQAQLTGTPVLVEVTGPEVPGDGLPFRTPATTCTWTVTLSGADTDVPVRVADFTTLDHFGVVYHPVPVAGQPAPPAVLHAHATATFELRVVMTVGEGIMRWGPGGGRTVASWDFVVEND